MSPAPADYVDVAERIRQFYAFYPDGRLCSDQEPKLFASGDKTFIAYKALAYRTPDDPRPGVGWAWEPVPGPTPFTRDSELQNAETSAWGRAIVALGFETKHIASSEEVRNRQDFVAPPERPQAAAERPAAPETLRILKETVETLQKGYPSPDPEHTYWDDVRAYVFGEFAKNETKSLTEAEVQQTILWVEKRLLEAQQGTEVPFG